MNSEEIVALVDELVDLIEEQIDFEEAAAEAGLTVPELVDQVGREIKSRAEVRAA
jgi:hypothetical protein